MSEELKTATIAVVVGGVEGVDTRTPYKSWVSGGPFAGQRAVVLRFMGCQLKCNWNTADGRMAGCNTSWTWNGKESGKRWEVNALVEAVVKASKERVTSVKFEPEGIGAGERAKILLIGGGEPLLRQEDEAFREFIEKVRAEGFKVHVQTNGILRPSRWLSENVDVVDCSPKFQEYGNRYSIGGIKAFEECGAKVYFRLVLGRLADLDDLREWLARMQPSKGAEIWLAPLVCNNGKDYGQARDTLTAGAVEAFRILGYGNVHLSKALGADFGFL